MSLVILFSSNSFALSKAEANKVLLSVVSEGNTEGVHQMLSQGANVNVRDQQGKTPLLKAIYAGQIEVVSILLSYGANVNDTDKEGSTALIVACENNYPVITEMITKHKVNLHHKNKRGYSALMISSMHGRDDIVKQLILAGAANGSLKDSAGNVLAAKGEKEPLVTSRFYAGL